MDIDKTLTQIRTNVILGRVDESDEGYDGDMTGQPGVSELVRQAVADGVPVKRILTEALSDAKCFEELTETVGGELRSLVGNEVPWDSEGFYRFIEQVGDGAGGRIGVEDLCGERHS